MKTSDSTLIGQENPENNSGQWHKDGAWWNIKTFPTEASVVC